MSNNILTNTKKTLSLKILNGKKKSKYAVQTKSTQRIIDNNIQDKLFQAKLHDYDVKQKKLLKNFMELNQIYQKCIRLSKEVSLPKNKFPEDIEHVVARIVDEAFGMRVVSGGGVPETEREQDSGTTSTAGPAMLESALPFSRDEIEVWDRRSPHHGVLEAIAARLYGVCARLWTDANGPAADEKRPEAVDRLKRDLAEILTRARDALPASPSVQANSSRRNVTANAGPSKSDHVAVVPDGTRSSRPEKGDVATVGGTASTAAQTELRRLRKHLALVTDRLKMTTKEKRDLLDAVQSNRHVWKAADDSLRARLEREIEKNDHLQSVVDEMYASVAKARENGLPYESCPHCARRSEKSQ